MQSIRGRFVYSASDLNNFLECEHLTVLDELAALGELQRPPKSASAELIAAKGIAHEDRYLSGLRGEVVEVTECDAGAAEAQTIAAMERGAQTIYQGTFFDGTFLGKSDFLTRVERPSARWAWSYEVTDTKLALESKPYFLIQLCHYSEHLARVQGTAPEFMHVVLGNGDRRRYRVADFDPYYRRLKASFVAFVADPERKAAAYPLAVPHCRICNWSDRCFHRRSTDDHLSLVANIRRDQIARLNAGGIMTVVDLAAARDEQRPLGMNEGTFAKLRRQATMQVRGRSEGPVYEFVEPDARGLSLMPPPDPADVFFDMEGDPLYEPARGLEYLFGCRYTDDSSQYAAYWGLDRMEEKRAFEAFVDFVTERRKQHPEMHVYHYADYERAALRRLAQAHATRENEVDDLLRGEVLVDLYAVVRQSLVISEPSYSIKRLERFYRLERSTGVKKGDDSIVMFEQWLDDRSRREILDDIERYNRDDCDSTQFLRDWLLERRLEAQRVLNIEIPFREVRKQPKAAEPDPVREALEGRLLEGALTPQSQDEFAAMTDDHRARYLLANLLAFHRREENPEWWAFFDRCENPDRLLEFDREAIGGLELATDVAAFVRPGERNAVYTYRFPDQHYNLGRKGVVDPLTAKSAGEIVSIDDDANVLQIKRKGPPEQAARLKALIPGGPLQTPEQRAALRRIAQAYAGGTLERRHPATLKLLLAAKPTGERVQPQTVTPESVSAVVQSLDGTYLFVQGPPGSGKSTSASRAICDLLAAGKRIGILSTGHKAIHNLLHKVERCAHDRGMHFRGLYKHSSSNAGSQYVSQLTQPFVTSVDDNDEFDRADYDLAAGTAWLFARESLTGAFDYLFIDEAGQVSLADALAVSPAARNVVLLGDPLQLAQVSKGSHPLHAGLSVLEHLLGDEPTVPEDRGVFLDVSYRMHPAICRFISESVYDGRLRSAPQTASYRVLGPGLSGSGLRYIPMQHSGNGRSSLEEADRIASEISLLLSGGMPASEIVVVTPYNAQRRLIAKVLREAGIDVRVGTVDKFQGQEADVVFYSMATSSGADMPRDIDFLFERNRFNVAISRARALAVLVASDRLTDIRCRTVAQMSTVGLLCRYVDEAEIVSPGAKAAASAESR